MLLSPGSTARSTMRPEVTAGPMERNLSPANVAALNLDSGLGAEFPAELDEDLGSHFRLDFALVLCGVFRRVRLRCVRGCGHRHHGRERESEQRERDALHDGESLGHESEK